MTDDELDVVVADLRRQWGDRLPVPSRDETAAERDLREEMTRDVLDRVVLPEFEHQRVMARHAPLTSEEHTELVDLVISEIFGLPRLLTVLRDPHVTDVLVFGADPVRVERSDGSRQLLPPLVRRDRDLERIIYDTATSRRRPFNRENPFVDLELEPGVRFHGEGFDVVQRPLVTIRRAAVFGMSLSDLAVRGMLDEGAVELLRAAIAADMNVVVCGRMGSGNPMVFLDTRLISRLDRVLDSGDLSGDVVDARTNSADEVGQRLEAPVPCGASSAEIVDEVQHPIGDRIDDAAELVRPRLALEAGMGQGLRDPTWTAWQLLSR